MGEVHELLGQQLVKVMAVFATRTLLFPLFTIRARLESEWIEGQPVYQGLWHCFTSIIEDEGIRGLYRGMPSHLVSLGVHSLYMAIIYAIVRGCVQKDLWEDQDTEPEEG